MRFDCVDLAIVFLFNQIDLTKGPSSNNLNYDKAIHTNFTARVVWVSTKHPVADQRAVICVHMAA